MKNTAKFTSPSGSQTLTIVAAQGKKGFNVKASVKSGKGKGAPKAITGCREVFPNAALAMSAYDKLIKQAEKDGWKRAPKNVRNAFTVLPKPEPAKASTKETPKPSREPIMAPATSQPTV